jgi:hypothetical protein
MQIWESDWNQMACKDGLPKRAFIVMGLSSGHVLYFRLERKRRKTSCASTKSSHCGLTARASVL